MYTYSLSYNTADNVNLDHAVKLSEILSCWNKCSRYIITHEHIDKIASCKDHLQIAFDLDTSLAPSMVTKYFKYHKLGWVFKKHAYFLKKHKGNPDFAFGYCYKEVPETGVVLYTNIDEVDLIKYREYYFNNNSRNSIVNIDEDWINYVSSNYRKKSELGVTYGFLERYPPFDCMYKWFIRDTEYFPSFTVRNKWKYNYDGLIARVVHRTT